MVDRTGLANRTSRTYEIATGRLGKLAGGASLPDGRSRPMRSLQAADLRLRAAHGLAIGLSSAAFVYASEA